VIESVLNSIQSQEMGYFNVKGGVCCSKCGTVSIYPNLVDKREHSSNTENNLRSIEPS